MQSRCFRHIGYLVVAVWILAGCAPPDQMQIPVENKLLQVADRNADGFVQRQEADELVITLREQLRHPHEITNHVLKIFDENEDDFLDEQELDNARNVLCFGLLPGIFNVNRQIAKRLDRNNNQQIEQFESQAVKELLFMESRLNRPRKVEEDWDKAMDLNQDKFVGEGEIEDVITSIFYAVIQVPGDIRDLIQQTWGRQPEVQPSQEMRGIAVGNKLQEAVDLNHDGFIDRVEIEEFVRMYKETKIGPGKIKDPDSLAGRLDLNRDGQLKQDEIDQIQNFFRMAMEQLAASANNQPGNGGPDAVGVVEPMDHAFDMNGDGKIARQELAKILPEFNKMEKRPHEISVEIERKFDLNGDNNISLEEIRQVGNRLMQLERELMQPVNLSQERKPVENLLEELADTNDDRFLDPDENRMMENNLREPHPVKSKFDQRVDFNGNGEVESYEIDKALRAREIGLEVKNSDRPEQYKSKTPIDAIFDLDENGAISQQEVQQAISFFIKGARRIDPGFKLAQIFDLNKDGFFAEEEMQFVLDNFLRPHPANYDFEIDKRSDKNKNFFIEPEEIGVAAGHTSEGVFESFEGIIEQKLMRQGDIPDQPVIDVPKQNTPKPTKPPENALQPETTPVPTPTPMTTDTSTTETSTIFQKKINIKGKKIAVVDLKTAAEIDADFSDAIIMFVENAFVNIGTASVVDRQNISKIISEYQFQVSELSDATTAVQIGKLAGADVIVIGALNYIGKKYYLNIKLIDVTTAEILGSSIETAADDTAFFDTCNTAVSKLF